MKVLIDTNVILDAIGNRVPYFEAASAIILLSAEQKFEAFITANVVTDIYYIAQKHYTNKSEAKAFIQKLLAVIGVVEIGLKECQKALELPIEDYEDALLAFCAKKIKADYIITRNLKDFKRSPVPAISPSLFLSQYFPEV